MSCEPMTLSRHKDQIQAIVVAGHATFGSDGIELLYGCEPDERKALLAADIERLAAAGYRARVVGRQRMIAVDLTNVGTAMSARYVK